MIRERLNRLAGMDTAELRWRARAGTRTVVDRARTLVAPLRWDRRVLRSLLRPLPAMGPVRAALAGERWDRAHAELARHFATSPARFVIAPGDRQRLAEEIRREYPSSAADAIAAGDRIVDGDHDLLGYRAIRFGASGALPDWHLDPVHARRAPSGFWSEVPYLDPAYGDHKIIWELNRQQHWLRLGRAWWLSDRPVYRARFVEELTDWLAANPPLDGVNWASMLELGFRSLSWIWALQFFADPNQPDDTPWIVDLLVGLDRQLAHVEHNLSYYFSPNTHLLGEALALYVCARALPELASSPRRATLGRQILTAEIARQIGNDGGHCERSTHYHRYTLDFYLLALAVARITGDPAAGAFADAASRLGTAARLLSDDRGRVSLIGDDDGGMLVPMTGRPPDDIRDSLSIAAVLLERPELAIGPPAEEARWVLSHPIFTSSWERHRQAPASRPPASAALVDTGYYISRSAAGDHLVIDGGPHGYRNAGHAHADALSLTLTVGGVPMLVDPGTACYTIDPSLRDRMRSTALHNTVVVDGRDQSVPRGPFHWAHTANGRALRWRTNRAFDYFAGSQDGYRPLEHRRHVFVRHGDLLIVADFISGVGTHSAGVHWHVDPRWTVTDVGAELRSADRICQLMMTPGTVDVFRGDNETGLGWIAPAYGRLERATTIRGTTTGALPRWVVSVIGLDARNPLVAVSTSAVDAPPGALASGVVIRIEREHSVDRLTIAEPIAEGAVCRWRLDDIDCDAHLLFTRHDGDGLLVTASLVDGSLLRVRSRARPDITPPTFASDLHLDTICVA